LNYKKSIKKYLTFSPKREILVLSNPTTQLGDNMPEFKVQKEYTNWEEIIVEANSKEEALEIAEDEWDERDPIVVDSFNYTGEVWVGEADE
jgi:hypothetical protein